MNEFFATGMGTAVLVAAQTLLLVGFVMLSMLFLVYGDRKIWAADHVVRAGQRRYS